MFSSPLSWIARAAAACAAALTLASCGGGVSANPSPVVDSPTLTILPATATMYPGLPTTFVLSGGTGAYIVTSNNQAILPISGGVTGRSVTLVPNPVTADTTVTLTLRDTGAATPVTATVTVRPGTLNNDLTVTPSATQSASCSPALCSGTDAEVRVSLSQGGIPLAARGVKFEVVSGSFTFIESPPFIAHDPPGDTSNVVTATDETGIARVRIRVTAGAPNQTAQVQVKDLVTGAFRRATFAIAQFNGNTPAFFALPSSITLSGPSTVACSTGSAEVAVFGGTPPYTVNGASSAFTVNVNGFAAPPAMVLTNGGKFTINFAGTGQCVKDVPVAVTDATGLTLAVLITNQFGTAAPPISLSPSSLALSCSFGTTSVKSSIVVIGGSGTFAASSDHPRVAVVVNGRTVTVERQGGDGVTTYPTTANISVTDGATTAVAAASVPANCPGGVSGTPLAATPSSVSLNAGNRLLGVNILISGGSGTYTVGFVSDAKIKATISGASLNISDNTAPFPPCTNPPITGGSVTVSDGSSSLNISVTGNTCN